MTVRNTALNQKDFKVPKDWIYRGEGNCNVVLSLPKHRKILRIRKSEKPKSLIGWILVLISDFLYWYCGRGYKDESRDIEFYSTIMRPLLGINYTSEATQVYLSRNQINVLRNELGKIRPDYRQHKTLQYGRAAAFDDFAFLPYKLSNDLSLELSPDVYSVEIKPKQGFRCAEENLWPECVFCMNQFLKLEKGRITRRTHYCPEDLFSGDDTRMKAALRHLYESPQNNFKIFKNGLLQYSEKVKDNTCDIILRQIFDEYRDDEVNLQEEFFSFLQKCLKTDLSSNIKDRSLKLWCECSRNSQQNSTKLPENSILSNILEMQMICKDGTMKTYQKLSQNANLATLESWSFVNKLLERVKNRKNKCIKCVIESCRNDDDELRFVPYLISAIAKDCSLMVTFCKVNKISSKDLRTDNLFKTKYGDFIVNIGVFDLYPKPVSTIQKHYKRNKEILRVCNYHEEECW